MYTLSPNKSPSLNEGVSKQRHSLNTFNHRHHHCYGSRGGGDNVIVSHRDRDGRDSDRKPRARVG